MSKTATKSKAASKRQVSKLTDFILAKAGNQTPNEDEFQINWQERKKNWPGQIQNLHDTVRRWLKPLEERGAVRFHTTEITMEEEEVGRYDVTVLHLLIGKQKISFYPKGMVMMGLDGKIDIRGPGGIRSIVLNHDRWELVRQTPALRFAPFDPASFQEVLSEVLE